MKRRVLTATKLELAYGGYSRKRQSLHIRIFCHFSGRGTSDVGNYSRSSLLPLQLFQAQNTLNKVQLTGMALVAFLFLVNFRDKNEQLFNQQVSSHCQKYHRFKIVERSQCSA